MGSALDQARRSFAILGERQMQIASQRLFERLRLAGAEGFPPQLPDPIDGWLIKTPPVQTNVNPTL